jgi:hypothetical protein
MLADKPWTVVFELFIDDWGTMIDIEEVVISGYWYERIQPSSGNNKLHIDKPVAYLKFHLVIASKFYMSPTRHQVKKSLLAYSLSTKALDIISITLKQVRLSDAEE